MLSNTNITLLILLKQITQLRPLFCVMESIAGLVVIKSGKTETAYSTIFMAGRKLSCLCLGLKPLTGFNSSTG